MKRILSCSAAAVWLLAAPARGQNGAASTLTIGATQNYVLAARSLQLNARAVNGRGAQLRGRSYGWQVSDPQTASIDGNGMLSGLAPGSVDVTVTDKDSGMAGTRRFYVYPGSVTIDSSVSSVQAGDTAKLSAKARDADGKTVPGVPFQWYSDLPGVARVSADGVLTGVSEGRVTVTAGLDMGTAFARFSAFLGVDVLRRADYKLKTMISTDASSKGLTALVPTRVAVAGNYVAGLTSLSNGGQAVVLWQGGGLQTLAVSGSTLNGEIVTRFESLTVNSQGDVAVIADTQAEWCEQIFALFPAGAKSPTIIDDTTRCSYWQLTPNSMDRQRNLLYRYAGSLYYRKADGSRQTVLSIGDRPASIDMVGGISNWSIAPSGKVLIEAQNSAGVSVYFSWDGAKLQKLFAVGDSVGPNRSQWANLPVEAAADEYIARIGGNNWSSLSRLKAGTWTTIAMNGQDNLGWVQDGYGAADGYVFFFADKDGKTSLMRNNGTATETLATYANWRELSLLKATGGDSAVAYGTLGGATPQAIRFSGTSSSTILGAGLAIDGTASAAIAQGSIPKGVNAAGTILRTYGDTLLRATPGGVTAILKPGDQLPSGNLSSLGGVAGNRQGDVAFTAWHGSKIALYAYRGGQIQMIADSDDALVGATVYGFSSSDTQLAVDNAGHVAAITYNSGTTGIFLYTGGASSAASAKVVARIGNLAPGTDATFTNFGQLAIDDTDRVAFIANTSAGCTGLFLWDQGKVR